MQAEQIVSACRLLDAEAKFLLNIFREFWEEPEEEEATGDPAREASDGASPADPSKAPAETRTSAVERLSRATAEALARMQFGGRTAGEVN